MRPISVLVPTADQPALLDMALRSIARQTEADQIEEVLVSENLMGRESEGVCRQFKSLPIRYIFQDPPLTKVQHFNFLFQQARADLVALLCDDDWWSPGHLQAGCEALRKEVKAVAWASACLHVPEYTLWTGEASRCPILWIMAGRPSMCETWRFDSHQILATSWIMTPFHASTLVIRRPALRQVVSALEGSHAYQDDRMLQARLGMLGAILYEPLVDTCVRSHQAALSWQFSQAERDSEFRKCTSVIGDLCEKQGIDPVAIWGKALAGLNAQICDEVGAAFRMSLNDEQLIAHGFKRFLLPHPLVRMLRRGRTILKNRWRMYRPTGSRTPALSRK